MLGVVGQLRCAVTRESRVLVPVCPPGFARWIATSEAQPDAATSAAPETAFRWGNRHRKSGRQLVRLHRPKRSLHKVLQRAGFELT